VAVVAPVYLELFSIDDCGRRGRRVGAVSAWSSPGTRHAAHLAGRDEGRGGVVREEQGLRPGEAREMKGGAPARRR
jgi:hypothetical protein